MPGDVIGDQCLEPLSLFTIRHSICLPRGHYTCRRRYVQQVCVGRWPFYILNPPPFIFPGRIYYYTSVLARKLTYWTPVVVIVHLAVSLHPERSCRAYERRFKVYRQQHSEAGGRTSFWPQGVWAAWEAGPRQLPESRRRWWMLVRRSSHSRVCAGYNAPKLIYLTTSLKYLY